MKTITSISGNELFNMTSLMSACKVTRERNNRLSVYGRAIIDGIEYDIHVNAYDENRNMGIYTLTGVRVGEITSYYDSDDKERLNISFYNDESLVLATQLDDTCESGTLCARYEVVDIMTKEISTGRIYYSDLSDLSQTVFDLICDEILPCDTVRLSLPDGNTYKWEPGLARYAYAKGRMDEDEFVACTFNHDNN